MNWILTLLFWGISFLEFELLGKACNTVFGYRAGIIKNWLAGYFAFFLLTLPLGYLAQIIHFSWSLYLWLQTLVIIAADAAALFWLWRKEELPAMIESVQSFFTWHGLKKAFAENWFGLVFIGAAMYLLISNQLGILGTNYDDYFYIGKMVNLQGADHLFLEDYSTGAPAAAAGIDIARFVNTYELSYAYLGSLFGIYLPFFARVAMSGMQYLLFYFLVREVAACFVSRKNAQYAIAGFLIYFIPDAFWEYYRKDAEIAVYSYDFWQFQCTPYYGSSVVRMSGLFSLFYFSIPLLKKIEWPKILWMAIVTLVLLSFSTGVIPIFGLFALGIGMAKCFTLALDSLLTKKFAQMGLALLGLAALIGGVLLLNNLLVLPDTEAFSNYRLVLEDFQEHHFRKDILMMYAPWLLGAGFILFRKTAERSFMILTTFLYLSVNGFQLYNLLARLSFGYDFITFRTVTAVQMLLYFLLAVSVVKLLGSWKVSYYLGGAVSLAALVYTLTIFFGNLQFMTENDFLGSGVSNYGWNFARIFNFNSDMMPDTAREIGDYFNAMPYGNYRFLTEGDIPNGDNSFKSETFLLASNRIELVSPRYSLDWSTDSGNDIFAFLSNTEGDAFAAVSWMEKENIQYVLTASEHIKNLLEQTGKQTVFTAGIKQGTPVYILDVSTSASVEQLQGQPDLTEQPGEEEVSNLESEQEPVWQ